MFLSKYAVARHIYIPIIKRAVVDFAVGADWTPAGGDVKISIDGGAAANVTNLPAAIAMGNGAIWDFSLTSGELTGKQIVVTVADSATKAVEDQSFIIETYGNASAQHLFDLGTATQKVDVDTIKTQAVTCAAGVTVLASVGTAATSTAQTGDSFARLGAPAGASVSADVAAIQAKTTNLPAAPASTTNITAGTITTVTTTTNLTTNNDKTGYALTAGERNSVADAMLDRDMSTGADSGSTTVRTPRQALRFLRNKWDIAAGTLTVKKEDDATTSWTSAMSTDAAAVPIIGTDPAGP